MNAIKSFSNLHLLFDKKFTFNSKKITKLDSIDDNFLSTPLWEFAEGSLFKEDLDETRCQLDDKELNKWGVHTSRTDLSSFVVPEINRKFPSFKKQLFTRAWCKMLEMLKSFPVIDLNSETINDNGISVLFLCEAPGSFVNAVNYYIASERPTTKFNWFATSLNPYYEQSNITKQAIVEDRFIRQKEFFEKWIFGDDDLGDILNVNTIKQVCSRSGATQDLVTGDGGISCIDEPDKQEDLSFPLVFHQFITAINCLKPGGSFILKTFNLFTSQSLSLVYLLNSLFAQVSCFKPVTSKSGNSEIYLVCLQLLHDKSDLIDSITSHYFDELSDNPDILSTSSLLEEKVIPIGFINQFIACSRKFKDYQKSAIDTNLSLFDDPSRSKIYSSLDQIKKKVAIVFMNKRYKLKYTHNHFQCDSDPMGVKFNCFRYNYLSLNSIVYSWTESYEKRKERVGIISKNEIKSLLGSLYNKEELEELICQWTAINGTESLPAIKMKTGKPFTQITNSRFIDNNLLYLYNLVTSEVNQKRKTVSSFTNGDRTSKRILVFLRSSLEWFNVKYSHFIAKESSLIIGPLIAGLNQLQIYPNVISSFNSGVSRADRKIIIIDPFNYSDHINTTSDCLPIIDHEFNLIESMVEQLLDHLPYLKPNDLLIIHSCSLLSRLVVEIIFILTKMFKQISMVPNVTSVQINDENNCPTKVTQLGIIVLFTNHGTQLTDFTNDQKNEMVEIFKKIKMAYSETRNCDKTLLEIFPIIEIFSNTQFCQTIFAGNFVQLSEKMESLLDCSDRDGLK